MWLLPAPRGPNITIIWRRARRYVHLEAVSHGQGWECAIAPQLRVGLYTGRVSVAQLRTRLTSAYYANQQPVHGPLGGTIRLPLRMTPEVCAEPCVTVVRMFQSQDGCGAQTGPGLSLNGRHVISLPRSSGNGWKTKAEIPRGG